MTAKEKRAKKSNVVTWIWMGLAFLALIVVVIMITHVNQLEPINDEYFVDGDGKVVVSMDADMAAFEDSEWEAPVTRIVYYVGSDGKIENVRLFYEYETEAKAREAMPHIGLGDFAVQKKLNGRYIILQAKPSQYEGATESEIRESIKEIVE